MTIVESKTTQRTKFVREAWYLVQGDFLERLWRISYRVNDRMKIDPNELRDAAQEMQDLLNYRPINYSAGK